MQKESYLKAAEYYSGQAGYKLTDIAPGLTVVGSDKRYPGKSSAVLYIASFDDRCLISCSHELVDQVKQVVSSTDRCVQPEIRTKLRDLSIANLGGDVCYTYAGVKLLCDRGSYVALPSDNVCMVTREIAGDVMTDLIDESIPLDLDYLLHDGAAFVYSLDGRYVSYAATHPTGEFSDMVGNVMVGTHRDFRGRGYAKAVVSATTGAVLESGRVAVWGTMEDNTGSIRTAESVGYQIYFHVFEIRPARW